MRGFTSTTKLQQILKSKYDISVALDTIRGDISAIRDMWKSHALSAYQETLAIELMKLAQIESEAWEAWERSKDDQRKEETIPVGKEGHIATKVTTNTRDGEPRFMEVLKWVTEKRQELLGVAAGRNGDGHGPGRLPAVVPVEKLTDEELAEVMDKTLNRRQD